MPRAAMALLLPLLLFPFGLGTMPLLDPDEGRHAEIAREMVESGDWLTPHFNGEPYVEKPAGFYWLVASLFRLLGVSESSARLPSALAALAGVFTAFLAAARCFGSRVAWHAAILLSTSLLYLALARLVLVDMVFSALVAAALLRLAEWVGKPERRFPASVYVAVGLAILVKGPVALVLVGGAVALYAALAGDPRLRRDLGLGRGLLLCALLAAPWYVAVGTTNPEYFRDFLWRNHVLRFLGAGRVGKPEPFLYYAWMLPLACLPWSLHWPAMVAARRQRRLEPTPASRFLFCATAVVIGFFSLSRSKLPTYVLPALAPMAILMARALAAAEHGRGSPVDRLSAAAAWAWAGLLLAAPALAAWWLPADYLPARPAILLGATAAVPALAAAVFRRSPGLWLGWTAASVAVLGLVTVSAGAPLLGRWKSGREPGLRIARALPAEGRVYTLEFRSNGLRFYSGRVVERIDSLARAASLLSSDAPVVTALRTWHRHELPRLIHRPVWIWWREWASHRMLVSNRPPIGFRGEGRLEPSNGPNTGG